MAEEEDLVSYKMAWKTGPEVVVNGRPLEDVLSNMHNKLQATIRAKPVGKPEWLDSLEAKISHDGEYEEQISSLAAKVEFMESQLDAARSKIDDLTTDLAMSKTESLR